MTDIYIISNKLFPNQYKVGISTNVKDRLNNYQTSDPNRGFKLEYTLPTKHAREIERYIHRALPGEGEWVRGATLELLVESIEELNTRLEPPVKSKRVKVTATGEMDSVNDVLWCAYCHKLLHRQQAGSYCRSNPQCENALKLSLYSCRCCGQVLEGYNRGVRMWCDRLRCEAHRIEWLKHLDNESNRYRKTLRALPSKVGRKCAKCKEAIPFRKALGVKYCGSCNAS